MVDVMFQLLSVNEVSVYKWIEVDLKLEVFLPKMPLKVS